jgi:hypothetical protein
MLLQLVSIHPTSAHWISVFGDMPTLFNYTVPPSRRQSYALTPAEIMLVTGAELNEYMGRYQTDEARQLRELKLEVLVEGAKLGARASRC